MSLALYFTFLRILITPFFPLLYIGYEWFGIPFRVLPYILIFLFSLCEFSDFIDGMIARSRNEVTDLGKVLDPMADSVAKITLFLTFTQGPIALPMMWVLIFFYRDFFISTLRTLCALRGVALAARMSGKMKAVIQAGVLFLILFLMIPYSMGALSLNLFQEISSMAVIVAAIYTALSAIDYLYSNRLYVKKALGIRDHVDNLR